MSTFEVVLTKNAKKDVKKLSQQVARRIYKKLNYFVDSGDPLDFTERLTKPTDAQYRWRIGDYRVLFDCDEISKTITVLKIQHRREVYKK